MGIFDELIEGLLVEPIRELADGLLPGGNCPEACGKCGCCPCLCRVYWCAECDAYHVRR